MAITISTNIAGASSVLREPDQALSDLVLELGSGSRTTLIGPGRVEIADRATGTWVTYRGAPHEMQALVDYALSRGV